MEALATENKPQTRTDKPNAAVEVTPARFKASAEIVDLGVWLSSLESFFASGSTLSAAGEDAASDTTKEFELTHAALIRCSRLASGSLTRPDDGASVPHHALAELAAILRDSILLSQALLGAGNLGHVEWKAWTRTLSERLSYCPAYRQAVDVSQRAGREYLPAELLAVVFDPKNDEQAELALLLPRFGKVLRWLDVVGRMLKADEPLKPGIVILACVSEQVVALIESINSRLSRFENEDAPVFGALDAASYTASMEMKKVYSKELDGVARLRPSPSIYARMETSHSLLNDSFQQILAGFVRTIDPNVNPLDLFPSFREKLEQSIVLRRELHDLAGVVQTAEKDPSAKNIEKARAAAKKFTGGSIRYLFYKDTETVERFVEEVMIAQQNKELVPILHRFGAYLDTLFGQVSLRAVLASHPFDR